jgi:XisH protein
MAKDLIHQLVKSALINDGWAITHDPYPIKLGGFDMEIDLGAETILAAERNSQKVAIEVKTFAGLSKVYDFHLAVGQFVDYRVALKIKDPQRILYVGITEDVYEEVFALPFAQLVCEEIGINILVVNPVNQSITKWISSPTTEK